MRGGGGAQLTARAEPLRAPRGPPPRGGGGRPPPTVASFGWPSLCSKLHNQIRGVGAQSASRIRQVAAPHQFTEQAEKLCLRRFGSVGCGRADMLHGIQRQGTPRLAEHTAPGSDSKRCSSWRKVCTCSAP
jgi:hypothetical protein